MTFPSGAVLPCVLFFMLLPNRLPQTWAAGLGSNHEPLSIDKAEQSREALLFSEMDRLQCCELLPQTLKPKCCETASPTEHQRITDHGLGVDIFPVAQALMRAQNVGAPLKIHASQKGWHYARGVCPDEDLSCFFKTKNCHQLDFVNSKSPSCPNWKRKISFQDALAYLTRPRTSIEFEIMKMARNVEMPVDEPCGVVHVRHSDVTLNLGWGQVLNQSAQKYLPFDDYAKAFTKSSKIRNLLLLTDDQNVIEEAEAHAGKDVDFKLFYLKRKRFRGNEGGWENHFPSGDRRSEMVTILSIRKLVSKCKLWVGTRSSFAKFLMEFMPPDRKFIQLNNKQPVSKIKK